MSKDRLKASALPIVAESSAVHGWNFVVSSAAYCGGNGLRATQALTPSAYACSPALVASEYAASERSAERRRPIVRSSTSLPTPPGPTSSASVPLAWRRTTSIWNSRDCAVSQPCRNSASRSLPAYTCHMPSVSRYIVARCSSSGIEIVSVGGLAWAFAAQSIDTMAASVSETRFWSCMIPSPAMSVRHRRTRCMVLIPRPHEAWNSGRPQRVLRRSAI